MPSTWIHEMGNWVVLSNNKAYSVPRSCENSHFSTLREPSNTLQIGLNRPRSKYLFKDLEISTNKSYQQKRRVMLLDLTFDICRTLQTRLCTCLECFTTCKYALNDCSQVTKIISNILNGRRTKPIIMHVITNTAKSPLACLHFLNTHKSYTYSYP